MGWLGLVLVVLGDEEEEAPFTFVARGELLVVVIKETLLATRSHFIRGEFLKVDFGRGW